MPLATGVLLLVHGGDTAVAQPSQLDYRVVFATERSLARRLEDAGRDGFSCQAVARAEPGVVVPGVVVLLARPSGVTTAGPVHRVVTGGGGGPDLQPLLEHAGAEGFRLCGVVLDEEGALPRLVAVMRRPAEGTPPVWQYGVEVLTNYKSSLSRLNAAGHDGFVPVAAAPVNNNRVPEMRNWLVVAERAADGAGPTDVAVRSSSGVQGLQSALANQSGKGYRVDLIWKEGNDVVAMMTRSAAGATPPVGYAIDAVPPMGLHTVPRPYLADVPYLSDQRLVVTEQPGLATNDVLEDALPRIEALGYAAVGPMDELAAHLRRNRDAVVASITVRRGDRGQLMLRTVMTRRLP